MAATEDAAALTTNVDALEAAAAAPLPDESQIEASAEKSPPRSPRSRKADGDKPAPKPRRAMLFRENDSGACGRCCGRLVWAVRSGRAGHGVARRRGQPPRVGSVLK